MIGEFHNRIFNISSDKDFTGLALDIFRYQARENPVYRNYINFLGLNPGDINHINDIPFLPVETYKCNKVVTGSSPADVIFRSSGTAGMSRSTHWLTHPEIYKKSILDGFRRIYGEPSGYHIMALLPSYLERDDSSLVYMVNYLIEESGSSENGFFLNETGEMVSRILRLKNDNRKILLIGVSFALLDLAEKMSPDLSGVIVMETGGMKGRRKELTREELHLTLIQAFNIDTIHSEYGMTELLSQAYSTGEGRFTTPPWLRIIIRDPLDPFHFLTSGKSGGINLIDLANICSCSFIETSDLGKTFDDGTFEVTGRFDNSDIRGCNLLVE